MATAVFTYNGENYTADNSTNPPTIVRQSASGPVVMSATNPGWNDVKFRSAMNTALASAGNATNTSGTTTNATGVGTTTAQAPGTATTPAAVTTTTTPAVSGPGQGSDTLTDPTHTQHTAAVVAQNQNNTTTTAAPADTTTKTTTTAAPARNQATIDSLNASKAAAQKQIDDINASITEDNPKTSAITSQLNNLQDQISKADLAIAEAQKDPTPKTTTVVAGSSPKDKYIVTLDDKGIPVVADNPNWDHTEGDDKYVAQQVGNKVVTFNSKTGDVKLSFTDNDAQQLATLQTEVAQKNADTARLKQIADENQQKFDQQLAQRVSNGEDAASVRAEQQLQINKDWTQWQEADGDGKRAQEALNQYEVVRHQRAIDDLGINNYTETVRAAKATEAYNQAKLASDAQSTNTATAAGMRNADVAAQGTKYSADQTAVTARMNAANSLLQSGMTMLADINKYLPPGSDLAGKALEGLMAYGQKFLTGMAGQAPTMPAAPSLGSYGIPGVQGDNAAPATGSAALSKTQSNLSGDAGLKPVVTGSGNDQLQVLTNNGPGSNFDPNDPQWNQQANPASVAGRQTGPGGVILDANGKPADATSAATMASQQFPDWMKAQSQAAPAAGMPATGPVVGVVGGSGGWPNPASNTSMANLFNNANPAQALFEQNAAAHAQTMQQSAMPPPPSNLAADGTPYANASDVARIWGR